MKLSIATCFLQCEEKVKEKQIIHPLSFAIPQLVALAKTMHEALAKKNGVTHEQLKAMDKLLKSYIATAQGFLGKSKKARSVKEMRLVMGCLSYVYETYFMSKDDNQDNVQFSDFEDFLIYVKFNIGHCRYAHIKRLDGTHFYLAYPRSISFVSVDSHQFQEIKKRIDEWLAANFGFTFKMYLEGCLKEELKPQHMAMEQG